MVVPELGPLPAPFASLSLTVTALSLSGVLILDRTKGLTVSL